MRECFAESHPLIKLYMSTYAPTDPESWMKQVFKRQCCTISFDTGSFVDSLDLWGIWQACDVPVKRGHKTCKIRLHVFKPKICQLNEI